MPASAPPVLDHSTDWFFWAALSACFAALTAIFARVGVQGMDSDFATLLRTIVVLVLLTAFVWYTGKWQDPRLLDPRALTFLALSGMAAGASWICYFRALKLGEASKVAPVDKFSVVLVAVFAVIFLGERPSWNSWIGIALVGGGVVLLALER